MTPRLATLTLVAALALTACSDNAKPSAVASGNTQISTTPSAAATGTAAATPTSGTTSRPAGPRIEYFRVKTKPSCPSSGGAGGVTFPGNGAELEWKITGGPTEVTISIDGPGIFGTYTAVHTETFPFTCSGPSNTTQQHKYTLKVPGTSLQQTLPVEAHIN